jgi:ribosomal protein S18 acetylase RimI-like enzyme
MNYRIVDGFDKMKLEDIVSLLRMTYWADKRPIDKIEKSVRNSSCYGIYLEDADKLAGFARVISDYATVYYLCDVIIDTEYRHKGLGTALISYIDSLPEFSGLRGFLITRNAHALYRKFGYEVVNDRVMLKEPDC